MREERRRDGGGQEKKGYPSGRGDADPRASSEIDGAGFTSHQTSFMRLPTFLSRVLHDAL